MRIGNMLGGKILKRNKANKADELWPMLEDHYVSGRELRQPFEQKWIITLAFLAGKQYVFFNQAAHMLQQLRRTRGRMRSVDNQLISRWRRQISDLIATPPIMSVVPNTNEDEDLKAAKVADKVLKAFWSNAKMKKKVRVMGGWIFSCGNVFLDDRWNGKLGPTEVDKKTGKLLYLGDVDCGIWSPFEILVPFTTMGATEIHEFPWMIKEKFRGLDYIESNYPRGGEVRAEQLPTGQVDLSSIMNFMGGVANTKVPGATVKEFYMRPCKKYPRGLFLTGANGIILQQEDWPIDHFHMEQFKDIDIPGLFWGKATAEDAIPLQKTWNRTISSINTFNKNVALGKGLLPRGSSLDALPDDTHGEWLEYTPVLGHKPEYMTHKGLPSTLLWSLDTTRRSFQDLYSQHEVTQGTNKSDLRSGDMARFLREQDSRGSVPTHAVFEESMEAVMGRVLKRIQQGYGTARMIKLKGEEGEFEVFAFKGADLRNNTDVSVKKDSSLPDSRLAREGRILQNFEKGLYGDPVDPKVRRRILNMLDDADTKDSFNELRLDEATARWENQLLLQGQSVVVNQYDNHAVHAEELNKFRKTLEYQKKKLEDATAFMEMEQFFDTHSGMHQKLLAEQEQAAMKKQAEYQRLMKGGENGQTKG